MANFNKVILAGRFSRDPELKFLPSGSALANFSLALNRTYKTDSGEQREEVCFIDITAFGKQAEVIAQHLRKGDPILVEGRLKTESWDDKQTGQKRTKMGVVLESFQFIGGEKRQEAAPQRPTPSNDRPKAPAPPKDVDEDDVPF